MLISLDRNLMIALHWTLPESFYLRWLWFSVWYILKVFVNLLWKGWRGKNVLSGYRLFIFKAHNVFFSPSNINSRCGISPFAIWVLFTLNGLALFLKFIFLLSFLSELFCGKYWNGVPFSQLLVGYAKSLHISISFLALFQNTSEHWYQSVSQLPIWKRNHASYSHCYLV